MIQNTPLLRNQKANGERRNAKRSDPDIGNKKRSIAATIVFGMPAKDCSYNGICFAEPEKNYKNSVAKCKSIAHISLTHNEQILFQFRKDTMHKITIRKHFGSGYFIVIEDFKTPEFIGKALGQCAIVIRQGIYPIKEKDGFLEVIF